MQRIQKGKFIMKKAISVLMIAACMLCMVTACEKKDKKENDTSAAQATETDCTAAERVTTEPEGEITISEMIDQRIKEEGKIMIYRMRFGPSKTPLEITEDLNVNIISYDGKELIDYGNSSNRRGETRLGDIIHNKVDYSTYNIGTYGGNWKRHRYVSGGDEKYVEEEGYVQREITTDDSGNNAQLETLYSYSKGTLYSRDAGSKEWNQTEKEDSLDIVSFGTFERIKLDGKTYMTFCVRDNLDLIEYDIIPDNKFTENKTVVYDTPGTEKTTVNTVDYLKKYQAVPKEELEQMCEEIRMYRDLGANGIVIGALTPDGDLDLDAMRRLMNCAGNMDVTLHRAFDVCRDPKEALEQAVSLGMNTILTSGQQNSAVKGAELLAELQRQAAGRIRIQAGGGICADAIRELYPKTGVTAYHMSGKIELASPMQYRKENVNMGLPSLSEYTLYRTDVKAVRGARAVLEEL